MPRGNASPRYQATHWSSVARQNAISAAYFGAQGSTANAPLASDPGEARKNAPGTPAGVSGSERRNTSFGRRSSSGEPAVTTSMSRWSKPTSASPRSATASSTPSAGETTTSWLAIPSVTSESRAATSSRAVAAVVAAGATTRRCPCSESSVDVPSASTSSAAPTRTVDSGWTSTNAPRSIAGPVSAGRIVILSRRATA